MKKWTLVLAALLIMAAQGNAGGIDWWQSEGSRVDFVDTTISLPHWLWGWPDSVQICVVMNAYQYCDCGPDCDCSDIQVYRKWDTVWYYRRGVDTAAIRLALDSMIEIPGIWQDNDNGPDDRNCLTFWSRNRLNVGIPGPIDSIQPKRQKAIWEESPLWEQRGDTTIYYREATIDTLPVEMPPYWLDPNTGYFHRPDGVYEAVPDSECVEYDNTFRIYYDDPPPDPPCLKWRKTNTLVWRKVEEE